MKASRRDLAKSLVVAALSTTAAREANAQQNDPASTTAELEAARAQARSRAAALNQVELPMETQPAVHFIPRS